MVAMTRTLVAALLLACGSTAHAEQVKALSGNDLYPSFVTYTKVIKGWGGAASSDDLAASSFFVGFVRGAADVMQSNEPPDSSPGHCPPRAEFTNAQLIDIVGKYMDGHPRELDLPASTLIKRALVKDFPCQIKKRPKS